MEPGYQHFQRSMSLRKWKARIFHLICMLAILLVLLVLATLLYNIIEQGIEISEGELEISDGNDDQILNVLDLIYFINLIIS